MNTEMKQSERKKGMGRVVLRLFAGLAAGGAVGFALSYATFAVRGGIAETAEVLNRMFQENAWIFQIAFFAALTAVCLICLRRAAALLRKGGEEELDRVGEYQNTAQIANMADMILQFLLFGLAADGDNPKMLLSVALFLASCASSMLLEGVVVRQVQRADPMKKGEVGSLRFNREWLESCDEAERLGIYKASWKSFQVLNAFCPLMEAAALLGKMMFDTGNFPIILVTILWAVHTGVYCWYSALFDRRGAGE